MATTQDNQEMFKALNQTYDRWLNNRFVTSYYQNSRYMNWGYWNDKTLNAKEACDNLVDTLMGFIDDKKGNILEVACGAGGATKRLFQFYKPSDITAINISEFQLRLARETAPGCNFVLMDATDLKFQDHSFDNLISVEAAFHFNTREKFFNEAYRVLKPGGTLVLSDILFSSSLFSKIISKRSRSLLPGPKKERLSAHPRRLTHGWHTADFKTLEDYKTLFIHAGFKSVVVQDITKDTWRKYVFGMLKSIPTYADGSVQKWIRCFIYWVLFFSYFEITRPVDKYILVSAKK
ncbi:MAG: methyltransferase domain-containing protein [Desulfobacteraceae bacterium]|nr:methyltransferase domain-containing protein [Desulfobacteraceae bacterium]